MSECYSGYIWVCLALPLCDCIVMSTNFESYNDGIVC